MVGLKMYEARPDLESKASPPCTARLTEPYCASKSFSANISSTAARSPAIAPMRLPSESLVLAAIAANASDHDAARSLPLSRI